MRFLTANLRAAQVRRPSLRSVADATDGETETQRGQRRRLPSLITNSVLDLHFGHPTPMSSLPGGANLLNRETEAGRSHHTRTPCRSFAVTQVYGPAEMGSQPGSLRVVVPQARASVSSSMEGIGGRRLAASGDPGWRLGSVHLSG